MSNSLRKKEAYNEALVRIKRVNITLFGLGLTLKECVGFWDECVLEARRREVVSLFYTGLNDLEIANKTGYSKSWVANITTNHLESNERKCDFNDNEKE